MAEQRHSEEVLTDAYQRLLTQLPGIYAAGVRMNEASEPVEVHILASTSRNPKQVARDVQSALFAAYGLDVDYRIISIAQLPSNPFESAAEELKELKSEPLRPEVRLQIAGIDSSLKGDQFRFAVHLSFGDRMYTGEARCRDTTHQRNRAIAQATLDAVHLFLGRELFSLLEIKETPIWGEIVVMSVIECTYSRETKVLVGAAVQDTNATAGIVRSTLDALNRAIGRFYVPGQDNA